MNWYSKYQNQNQSHVESHIFSPTEYYYRLESLVWGNIRTEFNDQLSKRQRYLLLAIPYELKNTGWVQDEPDVPEALVTKWLEAIDPDAKALVLKMGEWLPKVRKETPEEWRERNLKAEREQLEHKIRASELAFQAHIDELIRLKKIRDDAIEANPDLKEDIEVGFEMYRRKNAQEGTDEPDQDEAYA